MGCTCSNRGGSGPAGGMADEPAAGGNAGDGVHQGFSYGLLILITVICLVVAALLIWVCVKYNAKANPVASRTTHNTLVEVIWTVVPIIILIGIAIPSFRLLYLQRDFPAPEMTVKAIGNQWFWSYEYPEHDVSFDQYLKTKAELKDGEPLSASPPIPRLWFP